MLWHIVLVALILACQLKYLVWCNSVLVEDGDLKGQLYLKELSIIRYPFVIVKQY